MAVAACSLATTPMPSEDSQCTWHDAMLPHSHWPPKNPWARNPWSTCDYGFISPTPLNFAKEPWRLAAGESVLLRYCVVLHTPTSDCPRLREGVVVIAIAVETGIF